MINPGVGEVIGEREATAMCAKEYRARCKKCGLTILPQKDSQSSV